MAYHTEKTENGGYDIVIDGFEKGIAPSPHEGIANMQKVNISTESGEAMCSFNRLLQLQSGTGATGTLTPTSQSTVSYSGVTVPVGSWITIATDSGTGLSGNYYIVDTNKLSKTFAQDNSTEINNIITNPTSIKVFLTSGTSWTVPADFSSTENTIETIGAGGGGGSSVVTGGNAGSGGGGGGYSKVSNLSLTIGAPITYAIGAAGTAGAAGAGTNGGDTYFNGASLGASSVGAQGGRGGGGNTVSSVGGAGGASASGVGTTKNSGGKGGDNNSQSNQSGAGGGAAGPHGAGGAGSDGSGTGVGGQGDNGFGGTGGTSGTNNAGNGTEFDSSHGCGGGAGGAANSQAGFSGGLYGAGGSGGGGLSNHNGGPGTQGLIVITYTPTTPITTSATFTVTSLSQPIQSATEQYQDTSGITQYRYYVLDTAGAVWIHDTATLVGVTTPSWFLPEIPPSLGTNIAGGLAVLNGWLTVTFGHTTYWKSTGTLGVAFTVNNLNPSTNILHTAFVGHQGKMYMTDKSYIISLFPNSALGTTDAIPNIQSYASYTASTTTGTISALLSGSNPFTTNAANTGLRIPATFFTAGTLPATLTANTIYFIRWLSSGSTFFVYTASTGGSPLDIQTGAVGTQFFNTFNPFVNDGTLYTFTLQALNLPAFETAQCIAELGSTIIIGGSTNTLYPWDQVSATPNDIIPLPETNTTKLITVNNLVYVFAGQKGNIYITNGSSVSLATTVPDYCAGIAGTPASYIEPYFSWGDAMFTRGRVWFSILDQTAAKAGNCGGIWSFVPTNNFYLGQDTGIALRLENISSYGTLNGVCPVLIPSQQQSVVGPQYWSAWYSSISSPTYGIDFSDTITTPTLLIETDLIPTGTMLIQKTFTQLEYKLSTPLASGETIAMNFRQNSTDAFATCGTAVVESATALSGYFSVNFQKGQWLQLQLIGTPLASSSSSFCRLKEIRIR